MIKLISGSLFLALTFSAQFASAAPAIFCEDNRGGSWAMCADSGYSLAEHRPPAPGTGAAGGFTCSSAAGYNRCTYPAQYAAGGSFTPPPAQLEKVEPTKSFYELVGNYRDGFVHAINGVMALFATGDREPADLIGTPGGVAQSTVSSSINRTLTGGTGDAKLNATTINGVSYPGATLSGTPDELLVKFRQLNPNNHPPAFNGTTTHPWIALQGRAGSVAVTYKNDGCNDYFSNMSWNSTASGYVGPISAVTGPCALFETYDSAGVKRASAGMPLKNYQFSPCPVGYAVNPTKESNCQLVDVDAVNADRKSSSTSLFDGVCPISVSGANPFDPDCNLAKTNGSLESTYNAAGTPVTVTKDAAGMKVAITHSDPPIVSRTLPKSDGGAVREDIPVSQRQPVGPTTQTFTPAVPAGAFPGDTNTGAGAPGGSGMFCGSPGQPPCEFKGLDGLESAIKDLKGAFCGGPGQSPCSISGIEGLQGSLNSANSTLNHINAAVLGNTATLSGISDQIGEFGDVSGAELGTGIDAGQAEASQPSNLDGFFSQMFAFSRFTAQDPGYSCYQALSTADDATSVSYLGDTLNLDMQVSSICPLIEPRESTILATTELLWLVMAILIFIRFTI